MISYHIDIDNKEVIAKLNGWEKRTPDLHNLTLRRIASKMVGNSQQYFLTGQALKVRTGRLRNSIMMRRETDYQYMIGTNVVYAKTHELGLTLHIPEIRPVRAKALRWFVGGRPVFARRSRAHDVHMPKRAFLSAAIDWTIGSGQAEKLAESTLLEHIRKYWGEGA